MTFTELSPPETCDVCGLDVFAGEVYKAEVSVEGAMCPTPMTFHQACWEKASAMWEPDPDSYCIVDNEYPETQQWTPRPEA